MVQTTTLFFILITFYLVSNLKYFFSTKIVNNTEEETFGISGASTETENIFRVKPVFER